jgi:hypothetical protein
VSKWSTFWDRLLSVETARFILALMALSFAAGSVLLLMTGYAEISNDKEALVNFALGQMFALAMVAFHNYFGGTSNTAATGRPGDPTHVEVDRPRPVLTLDNPETQVNFGKE